MCTRILNDAEVQLFNDLTGINAAKVFISKNRKYYYVTIVDYLFRIRISEELARKFIE